MRVPKPPSPDATVVAPWAEPGQAGPEAVESLRRTVRWWRPAGGLDLERLRGLPEPAWPVVPDWVVEEEGGPWSRW